MSSEFGPPFLGSGQNQRRRARIVGPGAGPGAGPNTDATIKKQLMSVGSEIADEMLWKLEMRNVSGVVT